MRHFPDLPFGGKTWSPWPDGPPEGWPDEYAARIDFDKLYSDMRYWRETTIKYQQLLHWIRRNTDAAALDEIDARIDAVFGCDGANAAPKEGER